MSRLFEAEVFVLVVQEGSFTAAARRLGITKSYASKLVSRLEDRLGVRLLQRSTRKLALTEAGASYHGRCTELVRALEEAEAEATTLQTTLRGRLRVTLPTAFGVNHLVRPLARFKALHPQLVVEAVFTDRYVDLMGEGFDVAIRAGELRDAELVARRLARAESVACAHPAYLERRGTPREPEDLEGHECLLYANHPAPGSWRLRGPRGQVTVKVAGTLVANHAMMLLESACEGQGVAFVPNFHAAPYLREGRLVRVLPAWSWPIAVHALYPHARHLSAKVRAFVQFLEEQLRAPPWA